MKKYLFKQTKKAFSLFLAVVMLMSCWVWIAPEEAKVAQAAEVDTKDTYTIEIKYEIKRKKFGGGNITIKYLSNYGYGTTETSYSVLSSLGNKDADGKTGGAVGTHRVEYTLPKGCFPTVVQYTGANAEDECGDDASRFEAGEIIINGKTVCKSSVAFNGNNNGETYVKWDTTNGGNPDGSVGETGNFTDYKWPQPKIYGFIDSTAEAADGKNDAINLSTINKMNSDDGVTGSTTFDISKYELYDQYGVKIPASIGKYCTITENTSYLSNQDNGSPLNEKFDDAYKTDGNGQVTIYPVMQELQKTSDGTEEFYLVKKYTLKDEWGGTSTSKTSAKVTVPYPKYDVKFNGKGSVNDGKFAPALKKDDDSLITNGSDYTVSGWYNNNLPATPAKATAEGYTFYGFWSEPQPATDASDGYYYEKMADFAQPLATEDFDNYMTLSGVEKLELYTVKDENGNDVQRPRVIIVDSDSDGTVEKYYDAGVKFAAANEKQFQSDKEWNAWWCSNDYSIKFYDVDGKFIDEFAVKHGQTAAAVMKNGKLPQSAYINGGYTSGAATYKVSSTKWIDADGNHIDLSSKDFSFTKKLVLTPELTRDGFKDKYIVTFVDPADGSSVTVGTQANEYNYRQDILIEANAARDIISQNLTEDDLQYSYTLLGWSSATPDNGKYHVLQEDNDFDINNKLVVINSDWTVRDEATYYAVYRRHTKTYLVNFNFKDTFGADTTRQVEVKYGEDLVPPTDYVPYEYNTRGKKFTFANWEYENNEGATVTLAYNGKLRFTSENISIYKGALKGGSSPIVINSAYGDPVDTPFKVEFSYPDKNGDTVEKSANVLVDEPFSEAFVRDLAGEKVPFGVADLNPAEEKDEEDALYKFVNQWKIVSGAGTMGLDGDPKEVGDTIWTDELEDFVPTSDVKFEAVYGNPRAYYTVTYIDGQNTYSEKVLADSKVPAWTNKVTNDNGTPDDTSDDYVEDKPYVPETYKGDGGKYEFQGWFNEKQKDAEFKTTNGTEITTDVIVTGDLTLYSQFLFVPDTFSIKFVNYDGSEVFEEEKYEKGQSITKITADAVAKAEARGRDSTYEYIFIGWDKPVPTFCEGKDMVFTAKYKTIYRYYDVKWYNSKAIYKTDADGNNVLDDNNNPIIIGWEIDKRTGVVEGETVETGLITTTKHTYDSKLNAPSVSFKCPENAETGMTYVFDAWYYKDAEGNDVKYTRGMKITSEMEFYATYKEVAKTYRITAKVNADDEGEEYLSTDVIPDAPDGYVDATNHKDFMGWYTTLDCDCKIDGTDEINYECEHNLEKIEINSDITVYAKFVVSEHNWKKEVVKEASYYEAGSKKVWCECDSRTSKQEEIPMLTDNEVPTGIIYLGGKSWSSDGEPAYITDNDPISIIANADTDVIITANDVGKGVRLIQAFVYPANEALTAEKYGAASQVAMTVWEAPKDENGAYTKEITSNANFAVKLGDAEVIDLEAYNNDGTIRRTKLKSGEAYIIYYTVFDKATTVDGAPEKGNQLNTKVRTAKFIYDNEAPVFTVTGHKNGSAIPTYCSTATVEGIEEGATLTVNNKVVEVKDGKYVINYAEGVDNVIITATDKAGNTYSKKIKVSDHDYYVTKVGSTCYSAGYEEEKCLICGDVKSRKEYPTSGHIMVMSGLVPATCTENGYEVRKCEFCDYSETVIYKVDAEGNSTNEFLYPASGHTFDKNGDDIKYTTVTESTCKVNGTAQAVCTVCNGNLKDGILTKTLELDDENHVNTTVSTEKVSCTTDGYYREVCNDCGEIVVDYNATNDPDTYKATGHGNLADETAKWSVFTAATCYQDGEEKLQCTKCSQYIDGQTRIIPATGEHVLRVTEAKEPSVTDEGYIIRKCQTPGCTEGSREDFKKLDSFTVTFLTEDGEEYDKSINLSTGDQIGINDVIAPAKAADEVNRYTFAGWVEVITNDDGTTEGSVVKLPLTVTKNMTLKATYRATKIIYTHKFYVPNVWTSTLEDTTSYDEFATLVGAYGDVIKPASEPVFKLADKEADAELKKMYTFKFKGWKDILGNEITDFTVTESANFYAFFEAVPVTYDVIYYNGSDYVWKTTVDGGAAAVFGGKTPEKASDDTYHYEFDKWYVDASLKTAYNGEEITAKTQLYAGFKATAHTYEGEGKVIQEATCTLPVLTEYTCACGHKKTETGATDKHTPVTVEETRIDGIYEVVKCSVCGTETSATKISYSVVFKNSNGVTLQTSNLRKDDDIKYEKAEPTLADSEDKSYKFIGWYVEGDESKTIVTPGKATCDVVYIAAYEATVKTFRLTFVDKDNNTITTTAGLEYGYTLKAGDFPADLEDYKTQNDHCTFIGWSASAGDVLKADLIVKPVFDIEAHKWEKSDDYAEPDCEQGGGIVWVCTECGATETRDSVATGHKWIEKEGSRVEPNLETGTDGYYINVCTVCGKESEKIVIPAAEKRDIVITVKDSNGNAVLGALVELYQDGKRIEGADTNANGKVTFEAYEGKYTVLVSGVADAENVTLEITLGEKGYKADVIMEIIEEVCGCSCHRDGFWGIIFRFFQKIIKFFTGSIRCCSCPDERY